MKKTAAILLAFVLLFGVAGCSGKEPKTVNVTDGIVETSSYQVWSAYSTEKVLKEEIDYEEKKAAKISLSAVANEYESAQLIITAKEDVSGYYMEAADLTDGAGNTIAKENVDIYNEWYTYVDIPTNALSSQGSYPDGLVPIDLARDAGELKVEAGANQGIWITVYVPAKTPAGTYTGAFPLTIDSTTYNIPVSVKVYDYELPVGGENYTLYVSRSSTMMATELDSTLAMKEKYYEFFLDYRINLNALPVETLDVEELVAVVKRYAADDRVNVYCLPSTTTGLTYHDYPLWKEQILRLAQESTAELNLLEKAAVYYIDEPEGQGQIPQAVANLSTWNSMMNEIVAEIAADTSGAYDAFKAIDNWQEHITGIRNVVTCSPESTQISDLCNVWCPGFGGFFNAYDREWKVERAKAKGAELWWYGCNGPLAPYPTLHLDAELTTGRIVSWLQQAYQVTGQLYWSVSTASNPYEDYWFSHESNVKQSVIANGDGYLVYPGAKYGYDGPLPSMRLMAVRDGYEEYELLMDIEHRYEELADGYGARFDVRGAVADVYGRLYTDMTCTTDSARFEAVRGEMLDVLIEAFAPHGFLLTDAQIDETTAELTMYAAPGYTVTFEGAPLTGENNRYTCTLDLTKSSYFEAVVSDAAGNAYPISRFIGVAQETIMDFDDASCEDAVSGSEGARFALNTDPTYAVSGASLGLTVPSRFTGNEFTDAVFKPYVDLTVAAFGTQIPVSEIGTLYFTLFNPSDSAVTVTVSLLGANETMTVSDVRVGAKGSVQAALDIGNFAWKSKDSCYGIRLSFANAKDADGNPVEYTVYIDDMAVERLV